MIKTAAFEAGLADAMEKSARVTAYIKSVPGRVASGAKLIGLAARKPSKLKSAVDAAKEVDPELLSRAKSDVAHAAGAGALGAGAAGAGMYGIGKAMKDKRKKEAGYGLMAAGGAAVSGASGALSGALSGAGIGAVAGKKGKKKKRAWEDAKAGAKLFGGIGAAAGALGGIGATKAIRAAKALEAAEAAARAAR